MADSSQSKRLQLLSKIGLSMVAVALVLTIAIAWLFSSRPVAAIDQNRLTNYRQSLHSYASEGLLLAAQYQKGRPLSNYSEVSFRKLFEGASDVSSKLQSEQPEAGLSESVEEAGDQADDLANTLSELSQSPDQDRTKDLMKTLEHIKYDLEEAME